MTSDIDFKNSLARSMASGLVLPSDFTTTLMKFDDLVEGEEYFLKDGNRHVIKNNNRWIQTHNKSFEDETTLFYKWN